MKVRFCLSLALGAALLGGMVGICVLGVAIPAGCQPGIKRDMDKEMDRIIAVRLVAEPVFAW